MEVRINKKKELIIKHKLKPSEGFKIQKGEKSQSIHIFKKPQIVKGFSNSTEDGKGILTIDYDNCVLDVVLQDYVVIQKMFKLPQAYLFQTRKNNYHVVCLKKFYHPFIFKILSHTRCDPNYSTMPLRNVYKNYVLRLSNKKGSKKPKFLQLIGKNINLNYQVSKPHLELISKVYKNIKHPRYKRIDKLKKVFLQAYETI